MVHDPRCREERHEQDLKYGEGDDDVQKLTASVLFQIALWILHSWVHVCVLDLGASSEFEGRAELGESGYRKTPKISADDFVEADSRRVEYDMSTSIIKVRAS